MPTLSFRNYTTDDGLPSSQLYQVVQDKQGYLWFATDHGLSRYNGYEFTNYSSSDGLEDNTIFKLEFDKKDRLWMQSLSGKFFYLDNDKIYSFRYNDTIASIIKGSIPLGFCIDEANTIYFTSHKSNPMKIDTLGNITKLFEPTNNALYSQLFFLDRREADRCVRVIVSTERLLD
jgi:ligand-binding sensor domain-containing protein